MLMQNKFLSRLIKEFEQLNKVPKFQIERAISPLLGIFIEEIINKEFNSNCSISIPEFPIKKTLGNQSTNIDWLLIDKNESKIFLIELKTDTHSFDKDQLEIYLKIKNDLPDSVNTLFSNIEKIKEFSNRPHKYTTLSEYIKDDLGLIKTFTNLEIVYIIPSSIEKHLPDNIKRITFQNLPYINHPVFNDEWLQLKNFLEEIDL